jgi:hypothetical protein
VLNHLGQIALFVGLAVTLADPAFSEGCALRWEYADIKVLSENASYFGGLLLSCQIFALPIPVSGVAGLCYYASNIVMFSNIRKD